MAAEVIVRRGLDLRLDMWLDQYVDRLTDLPAAGERIVDWRTALGDGRRIGDWSAFFRAEVRTGPWQGVLATWWARLLPGIAAGSTHGVIRVGHAVRTLSVGTSDQALDELAHGLAFWAARSRPVPGAAAPTGTLDPASALDALPRLADRSGFIAHRLDRLAGLTGWPAGVAALATLSAPEDVPAALAALVDAATVRYLRVGRDSPVLLVHTATAPNAVLHCLPALPRSLWATFAGGRVDRGGRDHRDVRGSSRRHRPAHGHPGRPPGTSGRPPGRTRAEVRGHGGGVLRTNGRPRGPGGRASGGGPDLPELDPLGVRRQSGCVDRRPGLVFARAVVPR